MHTLFSNKHICSLMVRDGRQAALDTIVGGCSRTLCSLLVWSCPATTLLDTLTICCIFYQMMTKSVVADYFCICSSGPMERSWWCNFCEKPGICFCSSSKVLIELTETSSFHKEGRGTVISIPEQFMCFQRPSLYSGVSNFRPRTLLLFPGTVIILWGLSFQA